MNKQMKQISDNEQETLNALAKAVFEQKLAAVKLVIGDGATVILCELGEPYGAPGTVAGMGFKPYAVLLSEKEIEGLASYRVQKPLQN